MKDKFDISVIVCCYNPDIQKLKKTINSIYNQKNSNFEVIIADDGSNENYYDSLANWIKEMNYKNCRFNFLTQNVGTIKNIISAIEISQGKYVKTISPGDYFFDEFSMAKYIDTFEREQADFVFSRAVYYCEDDILPSISPGNPTVFNNKYLLRKIVLFQDFILGATVAMKRELELTYLNEIKDKMKYLEDVPLTFFSFLDGKKVYAISDNLIWYESGYGISTNSNLSKLLDNDYDSFFKYLKEKYPNNSIVKRSIKFFYCKDCPKLMRFIKRLFLSPVFIVDYFERKINRKKKNNKNESINKLKKIIGNKYEV
ncbi:MAG: glycosyltransferase [Anaeroplasma sp.]|nr:glycosyltransferase [Anaeroplasma sp.]